MLNLERHNKIIYLLNKNIRMTTNELCTELNVSAATIRNDLNFLDKQHLIRKFHGGAAKIEKHFITDIHKRNKENYEEKESIADEALKLIENGQCIILDASSTSLALARRLNVFDKLTVITNGIYTMLALKDIPGLTVIFIGGIVTKNSACTEGLLGEELLSKIHADFAFVSAHGFTLDEGLTDFNIYEVELKKLMLRCSKKTIALLDHTKFEHISTASFGKSKDIDIIITDRYCNESYINSYRNIGISVTVSM